MSDAVAEEMDDQGQELPAVQAPKARLPDIPPAPKASHKPARKYNDASINSLVIDDYDFIEPVRLLRR